MYITLIAAELQQKEVVEETKQKTEDELKFDRAKGTQAKLYSFLYIFYHKCNNSNYYSWQFLSLRKRFHHCLNLCKYLAIL